MSRGRFREWLRPIAAIMIVGGLVVAVWVYAILTRPDVLLSHLEIVRTGCVTDNPYHRTTWNATFIFENTGGVDGIATVVGFVDGNQSGQETQRVYSQEAGSGKAILLAIVSLAIASLQLALLVSTADPVTKAIAGLVLDVVAVGFAVWAVADAAKIPGITSMSRWSKALAPVSLGVSVALFGADLLKYQELGG